MSATEFNGAVIINQSFVICRRLEPDAGARDHRNASTICR